MANAHHNKGFAACSFADKSGEGNLAQFFLQFKKIKKCFIFTPSYMVYVNKKNKFYYGSSCPVKNVHLLQALFAIYCAIFKRKVLSGWINYCPLWNPLIFIIFDKSWLIGPITGQEYFNDVRYRMSTKFIRKYIFSITVKVSIFFIKLRGLSVTAGNYYIKKVLDNAGISSIDILSSYSDNINYKIGKNKEYDICIYESDHPTKKTHETFKLLAKLSAKKKYQIISFGKSSNIPNFPITRLGHIDHNDALKVLSACKIYLTLSRESAGLTSIEAYKCGAKVYCIAGTGAEFYTKTKNAYTNIDDLFIGLSNDEF